MERKQLEKLATKEKDLAQGDWVYTPDEVFGSGTKEHNVFQYDGRIVYSLHFGHQPLFIKLSINGPNLRSLPPHAGTKD